MKWTLALFILLILIPIAQAPCDTSKPTAECYNDASFYSNSDPARWDWNYVNLQKIDWSNNPKLQDELNRNPESAKKYLQKTGCPTCSLDNTQNTGRLAFSERGIMHPNGDFVSPASYYAGTKFTATDKGIVVTPSISRTNTINVPPKTDTVTIDTGGNSFFIMEGSKELTADINGKITFRNGQAYLNVGDNVIIGQVKVEPLTILGENPVNKDVRIFFDGLPHTGTSEDYLSINTNPDSKKFFVHADSNAGGIGLTFLKNNPFFDMKRDTDRVRIFADYNANIAYLPVSLENQYPKVQVTETSNDKVGYGIDNGPLNFYKEYNKAGGKGYSTSNELLSSFDTDPKLTTARMAITLADSSGNPIITAANLNGKQVSLKTITINENKQAFFVTDQGEMIKFDQGAFQPGQPLPLMQMLNNPTVMNVRSSTGNAKVLITEKELNEDEMRALLQSYPDYKIISGVPPEKLSGIMKILDNLPPEMINSLRGVNVFKDDKYYADYIKDKYKIAPKGVAGIALDGGVVLIPPLALECSGECTDAEFKSQYKLFYHEIGHEFESRLKAEASQSGLPTIDEEWGRLKIPYGKEAKGVNDKDISDFAPHGGCITNYACKNPGENFAETISIAEAYPEKFKALVDCSKTKECRIYEEEIKIACKYGALSTERCKSFGM